MVEYISTSIVFTKKKSVNLKLQVFTVLCLIFFEFWSWWSS